MAHFVGFQVENGFLVQNHVKLTLDVGQGMLAIFGGDGYFQLVYHSVGCQMGKHDRRRPEYPGQYRKPGGKTWVTYWLNGVLELAITIFIVIFSAEWPKNNGQAADDKE